MPGPPVASSRQVSRSLSSPTRCSGSDPVPPCDPSSLPQRGKCIDKQNKVVKEDPVDSAPLVPALCVLWVRNQEEVPSSGRRRFNFFASGRFREYFSAHEEISSQRHIRCIRSWYSPRGILVSFGLMIILQLFVARSVFGQLLAAGGGDPKDWKVYIANAPGKLPKLI